MPLCLTESTLSRLRSALQGPEQGGPLPTAREPVPPGRLPWLYRRDRPIPSCIRVLQQTVSAGLLPECWKYE